VDKSIKIKLIFQVESHQN